MTLHRSGEGELKKNFAFGDSTYVIGSVVKGTLNTDYYSILLQYSFFNSEKFRAGLSLGFRGMKVKAGIDAYSYGLSFKREESYSIPVILPGAHFSLYVLPSLLLRGSAEFLSVRINDMHGQIGDAQISLEKYIFKFLGAGAGYSYSKISASNIPENQAYLKNIDYTLQGFTFFAALRF
jgi:hypothetical protein